MKKLSKRKIIITVCSLVIIIIGVAIMCFQMKMPYAIAVDGKDAVIVKDKSVAEKVVKELMNEYKPTDSKVTSVVLDKNLEFDIRKLWEETKESDILTKDEAIKLLKDANEGEDRFFTATITGKTVTEEDYVPEIKYIKEDDMIAGIPEVEKEGKTGRQVVTRKLTTVNGEIKNTEIIKTKILDEGEAAVIHKGTLGLPEGEDWKTYEGDPVFNGADDLLAISYKYQGVPYKYGGTSLVTGVDCVQFVRQMFKKYGIYLPNNHGGIRRSGVGVSYSNMQKGDVICYTGHVAIYAGGGKIIHANSNKGVHISNVYRGQKIVTIRRIIK